MGTFAAEGDAEGDGDRGLGAPASRAMSELRRRLEEARQRGELDFEQLAACRDGFCLLGAPLADVVGLILDFAEPGWVGPLLAPPRQEAELDRLSAEQRIERALAILQSRRSTSDVHECLAQQITDALLERPRPSLRAPRSSGFRDLQQPTGAAQTPDEDIGPVRADGPGADTSPVEQGAAPRELQLPRSRHPLDGW